MVNTFLHLLAQPRGKREVVPKPVSHLAVLGAGLEPAWLAAGERLGPGRTVHTEQFTPNSSHWAVHTEQFTVNSSHQAACTGEGELGVVGRVDTTQIRQPWHL